MPLKAFKTPNFEKFYKIKVKNRAILHIVPLAYIV